MRTAIITATIAGALIAAGTASAFGATGYCGEAPRMIQNSVYATYNVSCREAKHLIKWVLGGSKVCYPNGYAARVNCYVDGFHCRSWYHPRYGTSTGRCVKGRKLAPARLGHDNSAPTPTGCRRRGLRTSDRSSGLRSGSTATRLDACGSPISRNSLRKSGRVAPLPATSRANSRARWRRSCSRSTPSVSARCPSRGHALSRTPTMTAIRGGADNYGHRDAPLVGGLLRLAPLWVTGQGNETS